MCLLPPFLPQKMVVIIFPINHCFGCIKETSQGDVSFMHPKHMLLFYQYIRGTPFATIKTIFRDKNTSIDRKFDWQPLNPLKYKMGNSLLLQGCRQNELAENYLCP